MGYSFIDAIPAKTTVLAGESLNVLGGVASTEKAPLALTVRLFGRCGETWKVLEEQAHVLKPEEHRHLYFTVPPGWFRAVPWDGEVPEEMELIVSDRMPAPGDTGVLIFIKR